MEENISTEQIAEKNGRWAEFTSVEGCSSGVCKQSGGLREATAASRHFLSESLFEENFD